MQLQVHIEGGFAYLPGQTKPIVLESNTLAPSEAETMRQLVTQAHFFDLPEKLDAPGAKRGADYRRYTITVEEGSRRHTVQMTDPIPNPELQAIITYAQRHRSPEK